MSSLYIFASPNQDGMYAIVDIAGMQVKARPGDELVVNRLDGNPGDQVSFDRVLLTVSDGRVARSAARVTATIQEHFKGDKVIVFKKKRRKGYKVKRGHRQHLTRIHIDSIS